MAQHDYSIANATGLNFRTDVNNALQAIATNNSGATEPAVKFAGMLWLDMSAGGDGIVRRRNAANNAWITDQGIDQVARDAAEAAQETADAALPLTGGTLTGMLVLPNVLPTGHQAVSRTQGDALYQVRLPALAPSGSLVVSTAAGWNNYIPAGAEGTVMVVSGGYPTWQASAQATALPNSLVRTKADGTIDPSFIPAVASGLKFMGTFKPILSNAYPDSGGSGAGGAPAQGDFWVVDGLTTGGYTYLSGSLAGVTVYNGDSIAFSGNDGSQDVWYKMGNSVNLSNYLPIDGSTAMTGALNMGSNAITNTGAITARAGVPVNLSNFLVDNTCIVVNPYRTGPASGGSLATMQAGQIGTDTGRMQIYVGTGASNTAMLAARIFSTGEAYVTGDYVRQSGYLQRAPGAIAAGSFTQSQWRYVLDTGGTQLGLPMQGPLLFSNNGQVQFNQPTALTFAGWRMYPSNSGTERLLLKCCDTSGNELAGEAFSLERVSALATFGADVKLSGGRLYGTALHNNASALTGAVNQYVGSGTYTPTFTYTTNCSTGTAATPWQWLRVGNVVTVSGQMNLTPGASGAVECQVTLPVASNIGGFPNLIGVGATVTNVTRVPITINGDATNDRARLLFDATISNAHTLAVQFTYLVA